MDDRCRWSTPPEIFQPLNDEFCFDLDVCAEPWNAKCDKYFSPEQDGLKEKWCGEIHQKSPVCWMNPPYGREIDAWIRKAYHESKNNAATVVCLVPARTETAWWHDCCLQGEIRFVRGRIHFTDAKGRSGRPRFGSAIVIFRP